MINDGEPTLNRIELLLLAAMTESDNMSWAQDAGLRRDFFEEPIHGYLFEWAVKYQTNDGGQPPTRFVLETECREHGVKLPASSDRPETRDSVNWLVGKLAHRQKRNIFSDAMVKAASMADRDLDAATKTVSDAVEKVRSVGAGKNGGANDSPRVWKATDLHPAAPLQWVAKGRLPRAAVTLLIGAEGIGKSLGWTWLVAAVTTGGRNMLIPEFGISKRDAERVLIAAITEDDWQSVVRPRLEVAGADLNMIDVICCEPDGSGAPTYPDDLVLIAKAERPGLIVCDAWLETVPKNIKVQEPQGARQALHPWKEIATTTTAGALLLCHTNRRDTANVRDMYGITGELRKKARMTLFALAGEQDGALLIGPEMSNISRAATASRFVIESVQHFEPTEDDDGMVPKLVYRGESQQTIREHLGAAYSAAHPGPDGSSTEVVVWLTTGYAHKRIAAGRRWNRLAVVSS